MRVLVTGCAGFVGFHLCQKLLGNGHDVVGLDSVNDYYSIALKEARLAKTEELYGATSRWNFIKGNLTDNCVVGEVLRRNQFELVIHLAAQPGVRYSMEHPEAYIDANITGFFNLLQGLREHNVPRFIFASSSRVYGDSSTPPFSENQKVDRPISLYAATKASNELMAHCYSHLFGIAVIGLRFFTVYGPWGRPDMAVHLFADAIRDGREIVLYREGTLLRDFTYVDDIVEGVYKLALSADGDKSHYEIYNIGNNSPVTVNYLVECLERHMGRKANCVFAPMQPGDVKATCADITKLQERTDFKPSTSLDIGIRNFVEWYRNYYKVS